MQESTHISNLETVDGELMALFDERDRRRAAKDPVFFVRRYLRTFDPRPEAYPHIIDFDPYGFQEDQILEFVDAIRNSWDDFVEKSRDMGVSWIILAVILWFWIFEPGFQALIGTYIEDFVDNDELDSLFGKLVFMIEHIKDPKILPKGFKIGKHKTYASLSNPVNGNSILGKAPTKKFGRSGRYTVVLFDELGFWQFARQAWAASGDSARCRIAITTPPDEPSFAKQLRDGGKVHLTTLHWRLHPLKDDEWYEHEKARRTDEEVLHELDISWEYSRSATVYPEARNVVFGNYPYNPVLPVYVSIDLGLDAIAVEWYQPVQNSHWWTLVDSYEKIDVPIDWFLPFFGLPINSEADFEYDDKDLEFIQKHNRWKRGYFFGDPSGNQRHVEDPSKQSAYARLKKAGIYVQVNTADNDFSSRRDAAKRFLPKVQVNDTETNRWTVDCWRLAHYPKKREESNATTGVTKPVHDYTSHHRTSMEFMAVNYEKYPFDFEQNNTAAVRKRVYDSTGRLLS